jgi:hypothetical protein
MRKTGMFRVHVRPIDNLIHKEIRPREDVKIHKARVV